MDKTATKVRAHPRAEGGRLHAVLGAQAFVMTLFNGT
jgi:hypothetical protein